jgi:adenine-specific DNA methylase
LIKFPSTRFQGSKTKLADQIWESVKSLEFHSALDAFGGTGVIGYTFKQKGKQVYYNDYLKFNHINGIALIENATETLNSNDLDFILAKHQEIHYPNFIENTFHNIYFTKSKAESPPL